MYFKPITKDYEWQWLKRRTGAIRCEDTQGIVAIRGGDIQAVVALDTFTVDSVSAHFAIDNPMVIRHGFLGEACRHVYDVLGKERIFGVVPENNLKALRVDKKIGFKEVARIPHGYQTGVDLIVLKMERDECNFIARKVEAA